MTLERETSNNSLPHTTAEVNTSAKKKAMQMKKVHVPMTIYDDNNCLDINILGLFSTREEAKKELMSDAKGIAIGHVVTEPKEFDIKDAGMYELTKIGWRFDIHTLEGDKTETDSFLIYCYHRKWKRFEDMRLFSSNEREALDFMSELAEQKMIELQLPLYENRWLFQLREADIEIGLVPIHLRKN